MHHQFPPQKKHLSEVENAWDAEEARPFQVFIPIELCFV
jgi:hypothetical protein